MAQILVIANHTSYDTWPIICPNRQARSSKIVVYYPNLLGLFEVGERLIQDRKTAKRMYDTNFFSHIKNSFIARRVAAALVKINGQSVFDLSHAEATNLIKQAGNNLTLVIER